MLRVVGIGETGTATNFEENVVARVADLRSHSTELREKATKALGRAEWQLYRGDDSAALANIQLALGALTNALDDSSLADLYVSQYGGRHVAK